MKRLYILGIFSLMLCPVYLNAEPRSHTYATWENMEIDKCGSAWLIKRFIDERASFKFYPQGTLITEGIPFDVPEAEIRRYHNIAAFEYLIKKYRLNDPALKKIGEIIHDIEINYWGKKVFEESQEINDAIQKIIDTSKTPEESLGRSLVFFDNLYSEYKSLLTGTPKPDF